jgi:hypothetical protein
MKYIERSDQKLISHLEVEETERLAERMREGVPIEEDDLGSHLARPREVRLPKVKFWERWPPVVREKERSGRQQSGV